MSQAFPLPEPVVDNIFSYAQGAGFRAEGSCEKKRIAAFQDRREAGALTAARAICTDVAASREIMSILRDRRIYQVAAQYLGYRPRICEAYVEVLFRGALDLREPEYQPFRYHYDTPGFGFLGFFFYLNAVDEHNGAHVMIRQSHNNKPVNLLLRSGQSAGRLAPIYYDRDLELTITGPKGHGFAEDLYSFHKVLRPVRDDRMSLQIRYY